MTFAARMIHRLALVTPTTTGENDEENMPIAGAPIVEVVRCLVQPRDAEEAPVSTMDGPELADHVIYMESRPSPANGAWFSDDLVTPDDGQRYDIVGVLRYDFGRSPHLKIKARLVRSPALALAT